MRLADYVMQLLEGMKVKHIFMLSGDSIMYLVDALGRSEINYVCCHHEQSAGLGCSMSRKGCSPDNSACEEFLGTKNEMFYNRNWNGLSIHSL